MVNLDDLKLPPHNIEAEKGVISCVLLDNESLYALDGHAIEADDFYKNEHKVIYSMIEQLWENHKNIDVVTLADKIDKAGKLEDIWGQDYLYDLSSFVVTPTLVNDYAKILKEKSVLRNILKTSQGIIWDVYDQKEVEDILETIEKRIFSLTQVNMSDSLHHIRDILDGRIEEYVEVVDNPEKLEEDKVMSGFNQIDSLFGGFEPWQLIIIAARPAMGKTSFALNLVSNVALEYGKSVATFSLEMGNSQLVDRMLSTVAWVPMYKISKWKLDDQDFAKLWEAMEKLWDVNIYLDDRWAATVPELKSKLRKLKIEKWWLDLVVIDYLQLMSASGSGWNRVQEVSKISRWLKELARELETPIIALSQLSRAVEQRPDKRPQLSDLRESWSIEQDADAVFMLYREDYYDPDTDRKWEADILLRKNRNGPTWTAEMYFEKEIMKFKDEVPEDIVD